MGMDKPNILYLNNIFYGGGAEKVTRQLYFGIKQMDANTYMLVGYGDAENEKQADTAQYMTINHNGWQRNLGIIRGLLGNNAIARSSRFRRILAEIIARYSIDIIHINNAHGNYIGIKDIAWLTRRCKVVWTLHDMWAVTGHCAHAFDCEHWKDGTCGKCSSKRTYPAFYYNNLNHKYRMKQENFTGHGITFVTPSDWLHRICDQSYLREERIVTINNGVDVKAFDCLGKAEVRRKYGIEEGKRIILFAAANVANEYKGFGYMLEALEQLQNKQQYLLLVIGSGFDRTQVSEAFTIKEFGYITDSKTMNEVYALADVFVMPSMADNFPCTAIESLASGTPVIGFATGGIPEIVSADTGWIVERGNSTALAGQIAAIFDENHQTDNLLQRGLAGRRRVEQNYTEEAMLKQYRTLYQQLLEQE